MTDEADGMKLFSPATRAKLTAFTQKARKHFPGHSDAGPERTESHSMGGLD